MEWSALEATDEEPRPHRPDWHGRNHRDSDAVEPAPEVTGAEKTFERNMNRAQHSARAILWQRCEQVEGFSRTWRRVAGTVTDA